MVQREMNYDGLQLPESRGSQTGSRRKPYIFITGSEKSRLSFHSPECALAAENFTEPLGDLKI